LRRLRKLPVGLWDRMARAQIWQGALAAILEVVCIALLVLLAQGSRPTKVDQSIQDWVASFPITPFLDSLATVGTFAGTLVTVTALAALLAAQLWYRGRPWREGVALLWALLGSEAVGLVLVGLLHSRQIEPAPTLEWPRGFAGLVPLRA